MPSPSSVCTGANSTSAAVWSRGFLADTPPNTRLQTDRLPRSGVTSIATAHRLGDPRSSVTGCCTVGA